MRQILLEDAAHFRRNLTVPDFALFSCGMMRGMRSSALALAAVGVLGVVYITARSAGLIFGGHIGARFAGARRWCKKHLGWCLLPQAGSALVVALLANERILDVGKRLLPMTIAATVVFEIVGPIFTQYHLITCVKQEKLRDRLQQSFD